MIDDKKIEEGSKKFRQDFHEHGDRTQGFLVQFGFEAGAKWAINKFLKDLWHSAIEKPNIKQGECCITCLAKFKNGSTKLCVYFCNPEGWVCDDMSSKDFKRNFKEWLYIDDLLQKGGEQ